MKVLLKRTFFDGFRRHLKDPRGTEISSNVRLPPDAKIWDGENWISRDEYEKRPRAVEKKAAKNEETPPDTQGSLSL